ncbi:MFS family permease [Sinomonas atrocyanea]|uniref:MFS transporter n=1 Tax=Sinomonas atrocyanea TaxID=37927 RepID=UPI002780F25A|nr:MFS transporter [Sinomonas atrocyanea]MDP9882855.1 MFS family permease [Sinomonas atrocyanea]
MITGSLNGVFSGARLIVSYRALELGGDGTTVGLITAAYSLLPLVVALPIGRAADGRHIGLMVRLGSGITVAALVMTGASENIPSLAVGSVLLGLGQVLTAVSAQSFIPAKSPPAQYDRRFAGLALAISAGQAVGIPIAGSLASVPPLLGHRTSLPLLAMAVLIAGSTVLAFSRHLSGGPRADAGAERRQSALNMLMTPGMRPAIFSSLIVLASVDLMTAYLPVFGEQYRYPVEVVTLILTARSVSSVVSRFFLTRLMAAVPRRLLLTSATLCSSLPIALVPAFPNPLAVVALLTAAGFFWGIGQPMTMTWVATLVAPSNRGSALSLRLTGNRLGQVFIPMVTGTVAGSTGVGSVFVITSLLLAGAGISTLHSLKGPP